MCISPEDQLVFRAYTIGYVGLDQWLAIKLYMPSIKTSFATISLFVLLVFACVAYVANAQEPEMTPQERFEAMEAERAAARAEAQSSFDAMQAEREAIRTERQATMASSSEERQAAMEERRAMLSERAQERITNLAANISNRMDAAVLRLTQIIDRLTERAYELNARGVDTDAAEGHLADAQTAVDAAAALIADIDEQVAAMTGSESPKEDWAAVRTTFESTKAELMKARDALRAAVAALKEAVAGADLGTGVSDATRDDVSTEDEAADATAEDDTETVE